MIQLKLFLVCVWLLENDLEVLSQYMFQSEKNVKVNSKKTFPTSKMEISTRFDITLKVTTKVKKMMSNQLWPMSGTDKSNTSQVWTRQRVLGINPI